MLSLALLLASTLGAGPRTDGVWLPPKVAQRALAGTASELDLGLAVVFFTSEVKVGYGMDEETRSWRVAGDGLEVHAGDEWRHLAWKVIREGVVKTDVKQAGTLEDFVFVAKTLDQLRRDRADKLKAALVAKISGKWVSGSRTLELGPSSTLDGQPVAMRAAPCNLRCEGKTTLPCADVGELGDSHLFLLQGKKLIEVSIEGACGEGEGAGVEPIEGAASFERK